MRVLPLRPLALVALLTACRTPTSVTLVLSSDVACSDHPTTSVAVSRTSDDQQSPALVTSVCQPDGHIGTVVVVPASRKDEDLRVRVVTSVGEGTSCEGPPYGQKCIVSRRQLRFLAHEELTVPIAQQVDCAGVACEATTTCRKGTCVVAQVDVDRCQAHPDECGIELAPDPVPVAGAGGTGGAGGESGSSGQGGVAGQGGAAGDTAAGKGGAAGDTAAGTGGAAGDTTAGSGGAAGDTAAGAGGAAGDTSAGASGSSGASGSTGVVKPPLPPLPAGAGTGVTYYVSPKGDDASDGKSQATAWQSLAKVGATAFSAGDSVLLEGGAVFTGCLRLAGPNIASTPEAPFTLGSYGGTASQLTADCVGSGPNNRRSALELSDVSGVVVTDLKIRGNQGGAQYGIQLESFMSVSPQKGIRIQNCDISGFYATIQGESGAAIFLNGYNKGIDGVGIFNNVIHGSDGPTSLDDMGINGFGPGQNVTNVLVQGNEFFHLGGRPGGGSPGSLGDGVFFHDVNGGVAQYNVVHHNGGNTDSCSGPRAFSAVDSTNVTFQYNEVYGMGPVGAMPAGSCGWLAYGIDGNVTGAIIQYNYSHDNVGPGVGVYINGNWSGNTVRYNISQNDGGGVDLEGVAASTTDFAVHNNTIFSSAPGAFGVRVAHSGAGTIGGLVANNLLILGGGANIVREEPWSGADISGLTFWGNDYQATGPFNIFWHNATFMSLTSWIGSSGQETKEGQPIGLAVDPLLTSPGGGSTYGGYDPGDLSGYLLLPGSPVRGKGIDVQKVLALPASATDYFGHPVPHAVGSGYNVGADGSL